MQTLVEAASHIAQEIERTRQHLLNLEQALEGLKPLITLDAATATLTFAMPTSAQPIEDLSVINAEATFKKRKSQSTFKNQPAENRAGRPKGAKANTANTANTNVVRSTDVTAPVKLPATGSGLWLKCLGRKKLTIGQLTDAALKRLSLDDSAKEVIFSRAKTWIYTALKKGVLIDAGIRDGTRLYQMAPIKAQTAVASEQTSGSAQASQTVEATSVEEGAKAA